MRLVPYRSLYVVVVKSPQSFISEVYDSAKIICNATETAFAASFQKRREFASIHFS